MIKDGEGKPQNFLESFSAVRFSPARKNSLAPSVSLDGQDWRGGSVRSPLELGAALFRGGSKGREPQAAVSRSPDSQNRKSTGNQGSPNFHSVEIDKFWDWKKRTAGDDVQSCPSPCPLNLRSALQDPQEIPSDCFYEILKLPVGGIK